ATDRGGRAGMLAHGDPGGGVALREGADDLHQRGRRAAAALHGEVVGPDMIGVTVGPLVVVADDDVGPDGSDEGEQILDGVLERAEGEAVGTGAVRGAR